MTSRARPAAANVTLQFDLDRNIDSAAVDVQTAIAAAMPLLPAAMTAPPSFRKQNPADQPILILNLTSSTVTLSTLDDYAETMIAPRISMVNGVSQVQVQGAAEVRRARAGRSGQAPRAGHRHQRDRSGAAELERQHRRPASCSVRTATYNIKAAGQLMNAEAFRPIVVAYRTAPRCASTRSPTSSTASRTCQRGAGYYTKENGSRARSARSRCRCCGSRAATPSRWPTRSARSCRHSSRSCRRRCT